MASKISLTAFLGLDSSDMKKGMGEAEGSAKKGGAAIGKSLAAGVAVLGAAAAAAAAAAAVAIASFVKNSITEFVEFEEKMNEVFTLLPDQSRAAEQKMTQDAKNLAREFGILPNEVVPALYQAISAGVPKENVFDFMEVASKAAIGGVSTVETAVDGLSTAMNTYGQENLSAKDAADAMFTAVKLGKTNFELLSGSMSTVLPIAKAMGVDFDQVMAAVATLTKQGVPTAQAMTQIRAAMQALGSPTTRQSEYLQQLGVDTEKMKAALAGPNGLAVAMGMMEKAAAGDNEKLRKMVGSVEALGGILAVTARGGLIMAESMDEMKKKAGANDVAYGKMNESLRRTFEALKATVSVGLTNAGAAFSRLLIAMGPALQRLADAFADLDWSSITAAMTNLGKTIAPTLGKLAEALGGLLQDLVNVGGGTDRLGGFIVEVLEALISATEVIRITLLLVTELNKLLGKTGDDGTEAVSSITEEMKGLLNPATMFLNIVKKILDAFGTFGPAIRAAFTGDVFKFVGELEKLLMKLATIVEKIPMVGKDAAESIRAGAKGIGKMGEEFRKIEEQAANKNKQREPKPTGPSFIDQMLAKKREEEAKKLEENRKALFALTKKPFWLTATVEDFRKVNENILKKAKIALQGQTIGPLKDLKVGSTVRTRAEIIAATGMTPEQIAATRRSISIGEGKRLDERLSGMFKKYYEDVLAARRNQIASRPTVSSILPMPQTGKPIARPVGTAKPPTVRIDANDMLKKMNTFYGTAIKDIQKSLRSIDYSLKGKFVNQ